MSQIHAGVVSSFELSNDEGNLTSTWANAGAEIRAGAKPYNALGKSIFIVMVPALIIDLAAPAMERR